MRTPTRRHRRGFTMIELLTVIGIIVALMAILLPVISRVRSQARVASTQSQINQIAGAIERYRADQGAYPGPLANRPFTTDTSGTLTGLGITGRASAFTMTENMVVGLCGGLEYVNGGTLDPMKVGSGATLHVVDATRRVRLQVYMDPAPGTMMPLEPWGTLAAPANGKTGKDGGDSAIPEFVDRFQDSRPLIYLRANVGQPGITTATGTGAQYTTAMFSPYNTRQGTANPVTAGDFDTTTKEPGSVPPAPEFKDFNTYLKHPTLPGVPRNKDQYLLISAGIDGAFGTKDDIFNSGNQ